MTKQKRLENRKRFYRVKAARAERLQESKLKPVSILGKSQKKNIQAFRAAASKGDIKSLEKYAKRITSSLEGRKTLTDADKSFVYGTLTAELKFKGVESKTLNRKMDILADDPLAYIEGIANVMKREQSEQNQDLINALRLKAEEGLTEFYEDNKDLIKNGPSRDAEQFFNLVDTLNSFL